MGLRGPSPKPYAIRQLEGSDHRVVALPTNDEFAEIPEGLSALERKVWRRVLATFPPGYFKSADEQHLGAYCTAVARWQKAKDQIAAEGEVLKTEFGPKRNPWLQVLREAHTQMVQLADRLGIGPARRSSSVAAAGAAKQAEKAKGLFFEGGPKK